MDKRLLRFARNDGENQRNSFVSQAENTEGSLPQSEDNLSAPQH